MGWDSVAPPTVRSAWRQWAGRWFYISKRRWQWLTGHTHWATQQAVTPLPHILIAHQTPLLRPLKGVDMHLQYNKVTNLRLAAGNINGLVIQPGETFSFWKRVGRPTQAKGYLEGVVLQSGKVGKGIGGGLCQMGNLLYWMALHTPLTVVERWRHSYDVFPDENRVLPFGSGATLAYNYIDLQLRNDTAQPFQLNVWVGDAYLHGTVATPQPWPERFEVVETAHQITHESWGGYARHNRLERVAFDAKTGQQLRQELLTENHALLMYTPFLEGKPA